MKKAVGKEVQQEMKGNKEEREKTGSTKETNTYSQNNKYTKWVNLFSS